MKWDKWAHKIHCEILWILCRSHFGVKQLQVDHVSGRGLLRQAGDTGGFLLRLVVDVTIEQVELGIQPSFGEAVFAHFGHDEMSGQRDEHYQRPEREVLLPVLVVREMDDRRKPQQLFPSWKNRGEKNDPFQTFLRLRDSFWKVQFTENSQRGGNEEGGDASVLVATVLHVDDDQQLREKQDEHQVRAEQPVHTSNSINQQYSISIFKI